MQDAARPQALTCPKCDAQMHIQRHPENDADRCEGCHGLWLPLMAHEQLEERADEIDTAPYPGTSAPETRTLACPECEFMPLIRMVDVEQPDLRQLGPSRR